MFGGGKILPESCCGCPDTNDVWFEFLACTGFIFLMNNVALLFMEDWNELGFASLLCVGWGELLYIYLYNIIISLYYHYIGFSNRIYLYYESHKSKNYWFIKNQCISLLILYSAYIQRAQLYKIGQVRCIHVIYIYSFPKPNCDRFPTK